jgi:molecular chaperone GrpE (heat shock protein)
MTSIEIVGIVSIILISVFSIIGIIVSVPLFKMLVRLKNTAEKINESIMPIAEDLNITIKKLNDEIGTIGNLTEGVRSIVEQLEKIIKLARILITSPVIKIVSTAAGFMSAMSKNSNKNKEEKGDN